MRLTAGRRPLTARMSDSSDESDRYDITATFGVRP